MSAPVEPRVVVQYDIANTVIRQRNACPVCHLPLCYGEVNVKAEVGVIVDDPDCVWSQAQKIMKYHVTYSSNLYGRDPSMVNAQICHLVGSTMIPEITKPILYQTPTCTEQQFRPEPGLYILPNFVRTAIKHKLIDWGDTFTNPQSQDSIFFNHNCIRMTRASEYLTLSGVHYFIACADCNMAHTGKYQIRKMMQIQYDDRKLDEPDAFEIYTMIFDSMADDYTVRPPAIHVTEFRIKMWQLEVWLNYCVLMFIAQHHKQDISSKADQLGTDRYRFTYAHRDMGMCDFYMNQILGLILYVNYDIDIDFISLHQNFLVYLPMWAKSKGKFAHDPAERPTDPRHDYNCMWRWVLGREQSQDYFATRTDLIDKYWYEDPNIKNKSDHIVKQIKQFAQSWLKPIGMAIEERGASSIPWNSLGAEHGLCLEIQNLFQRRCGVNIRELLETTKFHQMTSDGTQFISQMMVNPRLVYVHEAFNAIFPNETNHVLYDALFHLAFMRTHTAFQNMQPPSQPGTLKTYEETHVKFLELIRYIDFLLQCE